MAKQRKECSRVLYKQDLVLLLVLPAPTTPQEGASNRSLLQMFSWVVGLSVMYPGSLRLASCRNHPQASHFGRHRPGSARQILNQRDRE